MWAQQAARNYSKLSNEFNGNNDDEKYLQQLSELHTQEAKKLLSLCETNGGVYVKAGQFASSIESVPQEYREVLQSLQDDVPIRSYQEIKTVIEKELRKPINEVFSDISEEPAAAASLAQVHKALRKDTGDQVAVKVQYPGICQAIQADMYSLKLISEAAEYFFKEYKLTWLFEELDKKLQQELNFQKEAENNRQFVQQIHHPNVVCPVVHDDLTTSRLLTMEWIEGVKITDTEGLKRLNIDPRAIAMDMLDVFAQMTFVKGYIHGDPHAGNVIIRPLSKRNENGNGSSKYQIVLLDHGHYIHMGTQLREQYCQLWCSFVLADDDASLKIAMRIAGEKGKLLPEILNPKKGQKRKSVGAFSKALEHFPRPLVDTIRVNGIVRQIVTELGASLTDRLSKNGGAAVTGLPQTDFDGKSVTDLQFRIVQVKVGVKVGLLRWGIWLEGIVQRIRCLWTGEEYKVRIN